MLAIARTLCTIGIVVLLVSAAAAGEVVVPFITGEATISTGADGLATLSVAGATAVSSPGDPALPCTFSYVLLPPDADPATVRVQIREGVEKKVKGVHTVKPMPPAKAADNSGKEYWGHNKAIWNGFNLNVYDKRDFYPADYATTEPVSQIGPYKMVPVRFWPYRYNPQTGQLIHLTEGDVAITYETDSQVDAAGHGTNLAYEEAVANLVVNPEAISAYSGMSITSAATSLLIITTQYAIDNSTQLGAFVSTKQAQGFTVTVVSNDTAWGGGIGQSIVGAIKNYLVSQSANYRYCLILGNPAPATGDFPMAYAYPDGPTGEAVPTDLWYGDHTGNWDLDSDGYIGENEDFGTGGVDYNVEMVIGRVPCYGNLTDYDHILSKLIGYQTATTVPAKMGRVMYACKPLDAVTPGYQLGEYIRTDACLALRGRECWRMYDGDYGLVPPPDAYPTDTLVLIDEWNQGAGFLFWTTHGGPDGAAYIIDLNWLPYVNDVTLCPMTFQASCLNAHPETQNNLCLEMLKRGAINTIGATRISWYYIGETNPTSSDSIMGMCYRYAVNQAGTPALPRAGEAMAAMNVTVPNAIHWNHYTFVMYGDPTMIARWPSDFSIVTTSPLPTAKVGTYYRVDLFAAGGAVPRTWTRYAFSLPSGLYVHPDGYIYGTPTTAQTRSFYVRCTDNLGNMRHRYYTITVTN